MERMDAQLRTGRDFQTPARIPLSQGRGRGMEHLETLLEYELRGAVRYRRFATVVLMAGAQDSRDMHIVLHENIRASDEIFDLAPVVAILMGETDSAGALTAIHRFKSFCKMESDVRFALASFPADARVGSELLWTAQRRLEEAREREPGAVVSAG